MTYVLNLDQEEKEATAIMYYVRASRGLPPKEDTFSGLMNIKDIKERTRLNAKAVIGHSLLRLLAKQGSEWNICDDIADIFDTYAISRDGLQRAEAIQILKPKTEVQAIGINPVQNPQPLATTKRKHWWNRKEENEE